MSQTATTAYFPKHPAPTGAVASARPEPSAPTITRQRVEQGIADGRRLHGEAMRAIFRALFGQIMNIRLARKPGFDHRPQPC